MRRISVLGILLFGLFLSTSVGLALADEPESNIIVFDYSHGQKNDLVSDIDLALETTLINLGYQVVWARGGLNSSILSDAKALIVSSVYPATNAFDQSEIDAITEWFNNGSKFMWIGCDNDYDGPFINGNMSRILEGVGSHVYPESASILDPISNAGAAYRTIATGTSSNPLVSGTGMNVEAILMHAGTLLYGSSSNSPGEGVNPIAMEDTTLENVYPILYYNESAVITDNEPDPPIAHDIDDTGAFVAATIEFGLCDDNSSVLVVSGASPYGDYRPMCDDLYYDKVLQGNTFVSQTIDLGIKSAHETNPPSVTLESSSLIANTAFFVNATVMDENSLSMVVLLYSYNDTLVAPSMINMTQFGPDLWTGTIPWPGFETPITYVVYAFDLYGNFGISEIYTVMGIEATTTTSTSTTTTSETSSTPPPPFDLSLVLIIGGIVVAIVIVAVVVYIRGRSRGG